MSKTTNKPLHNIFPPPVVLPLLFSYMVEHIAISIYWIFFGIFLIENLTSSYLNLAVALAIPAMVSTIGTTFLSNFSDKTGRRKEIMYLSRIALMLQYTFLIFFRGSIWVVLAILASFNIVTQIYYTMHSALLTIICPPDRRGEVSSFQVVFASAGWMVGSAVSSFIYTSYGIEGSLRFAAFFALLSGSIVLLSSSKPWKYEEKPSPEELVDQSNIIIDPLKIKNAMPVQALIVPSNSLSKLISSEKANSKKTRYVDILFRKEILTLLLILLILDFGIGPFNVVTSVYLRKAGLTDFQISISNTLATAFGMILLLIAGRFLDSVGRRPMLIWAIAAYPIIYSLMFFLAEHPYAIFIIYLYPLYALKNPTASTIMSDLTSVNERARGMSLITMEQIFAGNIGAIVGCLIADNFPNTLIPRFISDGIFFSPFMPIFFGVIALILAIYLFKETNAKIIENKMKEKKNFDI